MSEYSYEIDKYIVGVDSNGEDGIGLTIATMKDNELHILGSCYGDNARFIDLLIKENQELNQKYVNAVADYEEQKFNAEELKKQKEELRSWLEEGKRVSIAHENMISVNFISLVLSKLEELEGVSNE